MDITLKQLQIFQAVVVAGSITKASRRVGLSQPSISQQLAKLEEKLGAQLIQRNRTGMISLTPSGEYWFKQSEEMLRRHSREIRAVDIAGLQGLERVVLLRAGQIGKGSGVPASRLGIESGQAMPPALLQRRDRGSAVALAAARAHVGVDPVGQWRRAQRGRQQACAGVFEGGEFAHVEKARRGHGVQAFLGWFQ